MEEDQEYQEYRAPQLLNGPLPDHERKCTDKYCLFIFLLFVFSLLTASIYAFSLGNPNKLAHPYDPDHQACGYDSKVVNYPYIYFANPKQQYIYQTVCVKSCPSNKDGETLPIALNCATNSLVQSCIGGSAIAESDQELIIYSSTPLLGKICVPDNELYYKPVQKYIKVGSIEQGSKDLYDSRWVFPISLMLAVVLSFTFLFLLERFAKQIIWLLVISAILSLFLASLISIFYYVWLKDPSIFPQYVQNNINKATSKYQKPPSLIVLIVMICFILAFILSIVFAYYGKRRINLAANIVKVSGDFILENPQLLYLPPLSFLEIIFLTLFSLGVIVFLASCGSVSTMSNLGPFSQYQIPKYLTGLMIFTGFMFFWLLSFLISLLEFVISGVVSIWYYNQGKESELLQPIKHSFSRCFKFHIGTVALGSFLIGFFGIFKYLLEIILIDQYNSNPISNFLNKICCCCQCVMDKIFQYISKSAYTETNITGKSYRGAVKDFIQLIQQNKQRFSYVGGLGEFIVLIGRLLVCSITGLTTYLLVTQSSDFSVANPLVPTIICSILGFIIGAFFMSVYGVSIDSILIIYSIDQDMNNFHGKVQYNNPRNLQNFISENSIP